MRSIGRAARQARRARKLTQEDVAERVGVSTQFYGRIERGYALPSVTTLRRMLEVLDLRADELLGALDLDDVAPDEGSHAEDADQDAGEEDDLQLAQIPESPRLRRVMRYLRRASTATLHVVEVLLDQMEQAGALRRAQGNAGPGEPHGEPEEDDGEDDGEPDDEDDGEPDDKDDELEPEEPDDKDDEPGEPEEDEDDLPDDDAQPDEAGG